ENFDEENSIPKHTRPGTLSMAYTGHYANGFWFFICTAKTVWLDGKSAAFGKTKEAMNVLETMVHFAFQNGKTIKKTTVANCGQVQ
ncbi:hypothetical protein P7K49_036493, partial [Saguinus oedipus]